MFDNIKEIATNIAENTRDFVKEIDVDYDFLNKIMDTGLKIWIAGVTFVGGLKCIEIIIRCIIH